MRFSLISVICLVLTACAQPSTQLPQVNAADVEAEKAMQDTHLYEQDFRAIYAAPPTRRQLEKRIANAAMRVGPAAIQLCSELRKIQNDPGRACVFDVELGRKKDGFNAYADGNIVVIGPRLVELIGDGDYLAFVLAHEFAHNIMNHIESARQNATAGAVLGSILEAMVDPYGYGNTGGRTGAELGKLSFSPAFEQEADYVGLYILARAGYNINNTPEVWRRMAAVNPEAVFIRTTHPTNPERFVAMRKAIREIHGKQTDNAPLLPEMTQTAARMNSKK